MPDNKRLTQSPGLGQQAVNEQEAQAKEDAWYQNMLKIVAQDKADREAASRQDTHDIKYENRLRGDAAMPSREGNAKPNPPQSAPAYRPMQIDPRTQNALQQEQLKKAAALFHSGQMDQINYGNMTPASQQLFLDYMQLWGPSAGATRGSNPNTPQAPAQPGTRRY